MGTSYCTRYLRGQYCKIGCRILSKKCGTVYSAVILKEVPTKIFVKNKIFVQ